MYAVIELQGHQWIVKKGDKIDVDNVNLPEGETLETDKILLAFDENQENVKVGKPYVAGKVVLKVEENYKGDKIYVKKFKNKIRADRNSKGKGFRPQKTKLVVEEISL
jgi:large subunit ribosomal protein L21